MYPVYKRMGMSDEDYWERDVELAVYFRKDWKRQEQQEFDRWNQRMWIQGMYWYDAVCKASPIFNPYAKRGTKPIPYREEPFEFKTGKKADISKEQQSDMKAKSVMEMWMVNINKKFEQKGGEGNG